MGVQKEIVSKRKIPISQ